MFSFIYVRINGWVNNRKAGDLRRQSAHYDVTVMAILSTGLYDNQLYLREKDKNRYRK